MKKIIGSAFQLISVLSLIAISGCGDSGRIPVYPVRGKVTLDGQPAVGAYVIFHPTTQDEIKKSLKPRGLTNGEGEFVLRTYEAEDGAPEGVYNVIAFWGAPDDMSEKGTIPENWQSLMTKYGQRRNPQFTATVVSNPQTESGANIVSEIILISDETEDSDEEDY